MASNEVDDKLFDRADAHIGLSNNQLSEISRGKVSASMMYATARFNAWVTACGCQSSEEMKEDKVDTVEYFINQYRKMLEENLEDYITNFDSYMEIKKSE